MALIGMESAGKARSPGTMVYTILDKVVQYFQEPRNHEIIQKKCIDPLMKYILERIFPYIILTCIVFSIILLLSLTTVGLLIFQLTASVQTPVSALSESAINMAPV
jgi:hypothetical protein